MFVSKLTPFVDEPEVQDDPILKSALCGKVMEKIRFAIPSVDQEEMTLALTSMFNQHELALVNQGFAEAALVNKLLSCPKASRGDVGAILDVACLPPLEAHLKPLAELVREIKRKLPDAFEK